MNIINQGGVYPTNKKEQITSIIEGNPDEDVTSNKTPILADNYVVKYEGNTQENVNLQEFQKMKNIQYLRQLQNQMPSQHVDLSI